MMLFNVTFLKQLIRNTLVFDVLMDFILLILVYLRFYSSMSDRLSFYFKLSASFKSFYALSVYIVLCLTNKHFVDVA